MWILGVIVDTEEGTWKREQEWGDELIGVPVAGTPGVLQPEYHFTAEETYSNGGVHRQCR